MVDHVVIIMVLLLFHDWSELKDAFDDCDHGGTVVIRAHDLGTALRIAGQIPTEADLQDLLQDAALDGKYK